MTGRKTSVSIEEGQEIILSSTRPLGRESIPLTDAYHRVLCEDIVSDVMIPPLDDSAMDGYAVIAEDTLGASAARPVVLKVTSEVQAGGSLAGKRVSRGTAIRIMTGAPVPEGADSIVQFEDTEESEGYVKIFSETAKYGNYRFAGESIGRGDIVLRKGDRLGSADVGLLASLNHGAVNVYRQPTVAIISTGDELAGIGEELREGQIRDANAYTLYTEIKKYSALPEYLGIAKDTLGDIREIFSRALKSDVIISTGGVSMGRYDFVKDICSDLGVDIMFQWVRVKPGKPVSFGKKGDTLVFGLPGNPVSTLTSFIEFVRPALLRLMGATKIRKPLVSAILDEDFRKKAGKAHLLRGVFTLRDDGFHVSTTGPQKSSMLRSMSAANCLIIVPEDVKTVKAGERVTIQLIDHDEI